MNFEFVKQKVFFIVCTVKIVEYCCICIGGGLGYWKVVIMPDIADVMLQLQRFSWSDYTIFVIMLLVCIVIGIYFGFIEKKENTEDEYLVGGRNMPIIPVALSLVARWCIQSLKNQYSVFNTKQFHRFYKIIFFLRKFSFISGITLLGLPTEVYSFGIQYLYVSVGVILMGFFMSILYLPVFHELNITSTYEVIIKMNNFYRASCDKF